MIKLYLVENDASNFIEVYFYFINAWVIYTPYLIDVDSYLSSIC
jgi:hypothetical protein